MSHAGNLVVFVLGGAMLGTMMNTLPGYDASLQPFVVHADENGFGQGRSFTAELRGFRSSDAISYTRYGKDIVRDTSAIFLVAELSISARRGSQQVEAIWLGATGRQYKESTRLDGAPRILASARFEPLLNGRSLAVFELPEDEIVGGRLVLMARGSAVLDSAVHFAEPTTLPERQAMLRLEP
ncbi:hypothetical protein [Nitratireductor pacificus]|uniref:Uncharacterized protein n=1 Tax=Nitratireductor pacificus pht-3B TaxID=391937 RepID=K2MDB9_9HYPH|nr:hypothetical protein [Nitratireductor pacificus]EKF18780.1 hypothetical protein NA2_11370 [Nitratireductor pacificus pht-3B]